MIAVYVDQRPHATTVALAARLDPVLLALIGLLAGVVLGLALTAALLPLAPLPLAYQPALIAAVNGLWVCAKLFWQEVHRA